MNSRVGAVVSQKAQAIASENPTGPVSASGTPQTGQASDRVPSQAAFSAGRSSTRPAAELQALVPLRTGVARRVVEDPHSLIIALGPPGQTPERQRTRSV